MAAKSSEFKKPINSEQAKHILALGNLKLLTQLIYNDLKKGKFSLDVIKAAAMEGYRVALYKAIEEYDPQKGTFTTFLVTKGIRGHLQTLNKTIPNNAIDIPQYALEDLKKIRDYLTEHPDATDEEIAIELNKGIDESGEDKQVSVDHVKHLRKGDCFTKSLDTPYSDEGSPRGFITMFDFIKDTQAETACNTRASKELIENIHKVIMREKIFDSKGRVLLDGENMFSPLERKILMRRFGITKRGIATKEIKTHEELAQELTSAGFRYKTEKQPLTRSRVQQIEKDALLRFKKGLQAIENHPEIAHIINAWLCMREV